MKYTVGRIVGRWSHNADVRSVNELTRDQQDRYRVRWAAAVHVDASASRQVRAFHREAQVLCGLRRRCEWKRAGDYWFDCICDIEL